MSGYPDHPAAQPFFLDAAHGKRFCIYHAPALELDCRGAFIYVHPFGDEMNKTRRIAALQARAFAAMGFGVLQIDLYGCGDSSGEFVDARLAIWREDLSIAKKWLERHVAAPVSLWGARLGGLLALDFASRVESTIEKIILWQPVVSGELFLTQFLRLRLAGDMLAEGTAKHTGTRAMRNALAAGEILEVAGYELAPALAAAVDTLDASKIVLTKSAVHWFEIAPEIGRAMQPARAEVVRAWEQEGVDLQVHMVPGESFWSTQEVSECPDMLSATAQIFVDMQP